MPRGQLGCSKEAICQTPAVRRERPARLTLITRLGLSLILGSPCPGSLLLGGEPVASLGDRGFPLLVPLQALFVLPVLLLPQRPGSRCPFASLFSLLLAPPLLLSSSVPMFSEETHQALLVGRAEPTTLQSPGRIRRELDRSACPWVAPWHDLGLENVQRLQHEQGRQALHAQQLPEPLGQQPSFSIARPENKIFCKKSAKNLTIENLLAEQIVLSTLSEEPDQQQPVLELGSCEGLLKGALEDGWRFLAMPGLVQRCEARPLLLLGQAECLSSDRLVAGVFPGIIHGSGQAVRHLLHLPQLMPPSSLLLPLCIEPLHLCGQHAGERSCLNEACVQPEHAEEAIARPLHGTKCIAWQALHRH
mmetsp:Transcript_134540/g.335697  ORF Transcript_134540/g.335697 Transcript_134540/m.335697 type:complete len:362 (-) Transcript_134540:407-1492(-)